ncbi:hypothetical protein PF010_g5393 [Phytophthora fragariae]|uniref:Retrovirus-related Pol polyprotein from transposon TNT 1-94-like beta-barrel domain-containing protein n=1 Tax=Phytophthora fragariae TaxID=53985 RepID=A0A6G0LPA0_9STRA|nr:hypothetical protein PF010_g5393 [Phytophthora fragariae]KAE9244404.1 hypothetical protein PF004_g5696 [Phytophthora fragariae]
MRTGHVMAGTVRPANFVFKGNSKREYPKNKSKNKRNGNSAGGNNNGNRGKNRQHQNRQESSDDDDYRRNKPRERKRRQDDSDDDNEADGNHRKVFRQERRESGLIAVATASNSPLSLTAQANVDLDTTWTIDSGCTRHVTHEAQWFSNISASGGSITVGGKNQIPIEGIGRVELEVIDSKRNMKKLILHDVLYAPQLHFSLL